MIYPFLFCSTEARIIDESMKFYTVTFVRSEQATSVSLHRFELAISESLHLPVEAVCTFPHQQDLP
jgi:hypothetical protein